MKALNIIFRILLILLLVSPILGVLGVFPAPTADMYSSAGSFAFINALYASGYMMALLAITCLVGIVLLAMNKTALAALIILPLTVNIVAFHMFLDGGLFKAGAIMAVVLALLNIYFLWKNRATYKLLWK